MILTYKETEDRVLQLLAYCADYYIENPAIFLHGEETKFWFGDSPLYQSARVGYLTTLQMCLELGIDINALDSENQVSALFALLKENQVSDCRVVEILLKNGADPNLYPGSTTTLEYAKENGTCVAELEAAGAT